MQKIKHKSFDSLTMGLYIILVFLGWLSIYSSSYNEINSAIFSLDTIAGRQIAFIFSGLIIGGLIFLIDVKLIARLSYFIYFITIIALVLVLFIGKEVGGAKAWFSFGQFGLQPAEFAKIGTILAIAKFMNEKDLYLDSGSVFIGNSFGWKRLKFKINTLTINIFFILCPVFLILLQPDAGSALVYGALIIMFYREGLKLRYVLSILIITILLFSTLIMGVSNTIILLILMTVILIYLLKRHKKKFLLGLVFFILSAFIISSINYAYQNVLQPHQKERIDLILGKETNTLGSGYNLNQSLIAIGSGGLAGKGYLKGTQTKGNFIPEQNTDFIFCTIGEEFGFLGSLFVIILFTSLLVRIIVLSEKQTSRFNRIIGYSLSSILFAHIFINISMTTGLLPVIGIPLPFFSYGGSSLLAFSILLFIFLKFDSCKMERF